MVGALALLVGGVLLYARESLFDSEELAERAAASLTDEQVRLAISPTIADAIGEVSPADQPSPEAVAEALEDPRVVAAFGSAAGLAADQLLADRRGALVVDLSEVSAVAIRVTEGIAPADLGLERSDFESARLDLIEAEAVLDLLDAAEGLGWLGLILAPLGLLALIASVLVAPDRLRGLAGASFAVAIAAGLALALLYVGREVVAAQFNNELIRDAVAGAWEAIFGDLRTWAIVTAAVGLAIALVSSVAAGRRGRAY